MSSLVSAAAVSALVVGVPLLAVTRSPRRPPGVQATDLGSALVEATQAREELLLSSRREERELIIETDLLVDHVASEQECALVEGSDNRYLLGIFYEDLQAGVKPTVVVFADTARHTTQTIREVVWHEYGHRLEELGPQYGRHGAGCEWDGNGGMREVRPGARTVAKTGSHSHASGYSWNTGCPLCLLHDHLSLAERLGAGLARESIVAHRIPPGAGGTVPGIRLHLAEAAATLPLVARMTDRQGELRSVGNLIDAARTSWEGWASADSVAASADATTAAWWAAYRLVVAIYAGGRV